MDVMHQRTYSQIFFVDENSVMPVTDGRFRDKTYPLIRCEAKRSADAVHAEFAVEKVFVNEF